MPSITEQIPSVTEEKAEEFEEVTETRIVGITEKGVIRKRSFKRKVRKEDKSKRAYGHNQEEYAKIRQRILQSKMASESIGNLTQRFRMIQMMHQDCMDLISGWKKTRDERIKRGHGHDLETTFVTIGVALCVICFLYHWLFL